MEVFAVDLLWLAPVGAVLALAFAVILAMRVLKQPEGNDEMKRISGAISRGANAYLTKQYKGVSLFFFIVFALLLILYFWDLLPSIFIPFAFLTGGIFSGLAGFVGMKIATKSNARTANAAMKSINTGLRVAFSAGGVMGFVVVGLGLLYVSGWYYFLRYWFEANPVSGMDLNTTISSVMITFGMGASAFALFARVGGGIFTKAADVGADLVGKVEVGIPEDDPRNPAVIADNVGDNVGDVAGHGRPTCSNPMSARSSRAARWPSARGWAQPVWRFPSCSPPSASLRRLSAASLYVRRKTPRRRACSWPCAAAPGFPACSWRSLPIS